MSGSSSRPSKCAPIQAGIEAPQSRGHTPQLGEIGDRQDAGHDRHLRSRAAHGPVAEAQEQRRNEKKLGDRAVGAGIELGLQIVEILAGAACTRDGFRGKRRTLISKSATRFQPGNEINGISIAVGMRWGNRQRRPDQREGRRATRRCAGCPPASSYVPRRPSRPGSLRRRSGGPPAQAVSGGSGARSHGCARRRAAGSIGHRDERGAQRLQPLDAAHSRSSISGVGGKNSNEMRGGPASKSLTGSAPSRPRA